MNQHSIGRGKAHGKIILLGEHSVVYKEPAIAIPFPVATITAIVKLGTNKTTIDCDFYHGLLDDMPELLESLKETIRVCLHRLKKENTPLDITIDSQIPAERGMGSSAAVSVAITRAIFHFFDEYLTQDELLDIVACAEKIAHGNPSGLDALMTSSDTPYYYIKDEPFISLNLDVDAVLIVADTGETGQTKEAVQHIANLVSTDSSSKNNIKELGRIVRQATYALENNEPNVLGSLMNKAHFLLNSLGVSNDTLNNLVNSALKEGALGAKLTGGGRGGCMIALASSTKQAKEIALILENEGATKTWLYEMSGKNE